MKRITCRNYRIFLPTFLCVEFIGSDDKKENIKVKFGINENIIINMLLWNKLKETGSEIMCIGNKQNKNIEKKNISRTHIRTIHRTYYIIMLGQICQSFFLLLLLVASVVIYR